MDNKSQYVDVTSSRSATNLAEGVSIAPLSPEDEQPVSNLIRHNIEPFVAAKSTLAATFRRVENLLEIYSQEGSRLFVAKHPAFDNTPIGCGGLGPLQGLSPSEGIGEIRDLVVDKSFRGRGLGSKLLYQCIAMGKRLGYHRLYLETTNNMLLARKLFVRTGFRLVTEKTSSQGAESAKNEDLPCYFLLENLKDVTLPD